MYHKIIGAGYLGRDPESRYTPSGQAVTNMNVATSRKWTDKDGTTHEETVWFRIAVWGKQAESCHQYLKKGSPILFEGRLTPNEAGNPRLWTDKEGNTHASYEITAQMIRFLPSRNGSSATPSVESIPGFDVPAGIDNNGDVF